MWKSICSLRGDESFPREVIFFRNSVRFRRRRHRRHLRRFFDAVTTESDAKNNNNVTVRVLCI